MYIFSLGNISKASVVQECVKSADSGAQEYAFSEGCVDAFP